MNPAPVKNVALHKQLTSQSPWGDIGLGLTLYHDVYPSFGFHLILSLTEFFMSYNHASTSTLGRTAVAPAGVHSFLLEIGNLMGAMLSPGQLIRDVEAMGKLLRQASRIEPRNPEGAAALRRQASRIVR